MKNSIVKLSQKEISIISGGADTNTTQGNFLQRMWQGLCEYKGTAALTAFIITAIPLIIGHEKSKINTKKLEDRNLQNAIFDSLQDKKPYMAEGSLENE
ncbi:MAG: hypothetical protein WCH10_00235 [bacterium]